MKVTKPFLSPVVVVPLGSVVVAVLMMFMTTKIGSPRTEASRQSFGYDTIRYDAMRSKPSLECFQFSAFLFSVFSTTIKLVSDLGCFVCLGAQRATSHKPHTRIADPKPQPRLLSISAMLQCPKMMKISGKSLLPNGRLTSFIKLDVQQLVNPRMNIVTAIHLRTFCSDRLIPAIGHLLLAACLVETFDFIDHGLFIFSQEQILKFLFGFSCCLFCFLCDATQEISTNTLVTLAQAHTHSLKFTTTAQLQLQRQH